MSKVVTSYGKAVEISVSWVDSEDGIAPPRAVKAGNSCYVARAKHQGEYIPGKLVEGHNSVYISYDGKEIPKSQYQVLVETGILNESGYEWNWLDDNKLPKYAFVAGTDNGRPLYIARCEINDEVAVGKYLPENSCSYIPYGGKEHHQNKVEILCSLAQFL